MMEKKFGDFLFAALPDQSRTCPRYAYLVLSMTYEGDRVCFTLSDFYKQTVICFFFFLS